MFNAQQARSASTTMSRLPTRSTTASSKVQEDMDLWDIELRGIVQDVFKGIANGQKLVEVGEHTLTHKFMTLSEFEEPDASARL